MNQKGQAQILAATVIGFFMLAGILASLEMASQYTRNRNKVNRRTQMREAIDIAAKQIAYTYQGQAACDPVLLNQSLNSLSAVLPPPPAAGGLTYNRSKAIQVAGTDYIVHFGRLKKLNKDPPAPDLFEVVHGQPTLVLADAAVGESQDVAVEMWTTFANRRAAAVAGGAVNSSLDKVQQYVILLNTCNNPCRQDQTESGCNRQTTNLSAVYYQMPSNASLIPAAITAPSTRFCQGVASQRGNLNTGAGLFIDIFDLTILKTYLRSGGVLESSQAIIEGLPIGGLPGPGAVFGDGNVIFPQACADLNRDGRINETDLNIMEKYLRGYINWLPVHY